MKTRYEDLHFRPIEQKAKTDVWQCGSNKGDFTLGIVKWHPAWRQYCFFPNAETVFSSGCLADVNNFMDELNKLHKAKR